VATDKSEEEDEDKEEALDNPELESSGVGIEEEEAAAIVIVEPLFDDKKSWRFWKKVRM